MKRNVILSAVISSFVLLTMSCGGGKNAEQLNDTVVSTSLSDSISSAMGAFMGVNLQDEVRYLQDVDDYIAGYQLVAGQKYSTAKLMGIRAGLYIADQFMRMEEEGIKVNRSLYLNEFRKYIRKFDISQTEYPLLYENVQNLQAEVMAILERREALRNNENVEVVADTVAIEELVTPDSVQTEINVETVNEIEASSQVI